MTILPYTFQGIIYCVFLIYLFLGISIISDVFMAAIEVITSARRTFYRPDDHGHMVKVSVNVWNPTVANLSLMALGSSAPEILLNCIETIQGLTSGEKPGELGAATIVGSAAFNFLIITGVSVASVSAESDEARTEEDLVEDGTPRGVKKVRDLGVFTITSIFSMVAYGWLLFVLSNNTKVLTKKNPVSGKDEPVVINGAVQFTKESDPYVELWEAIVTFVTFFVLMAAAYTADRINSARTKQRETEKLGHAGKDADPE